MGEPEEVPSESQWAELEGILRDHPASWMLWEGEPEVKTVERLQALDIECVVLDPCANRSSMGDFLTVMSENARALDRVLRQDSGDTD